MEALALAEEQPERMFYEFEPHLERCACGENMLWYEMVTGTSPNSASIKKPNGRDGTKRRFKCCCVCAEIEAREWRRKHGHRTAQTYS
jgi:hypothetical protein